jgi:hypothetical protein
MAFCTCTKPLFIAPNRKSANALPVGAPLKEKLLATPFG